ALVSCNSPGMRGPDNGRPRRQTGRTPRQRTGPDLARSVAPLEPGLESCAATCNRLPVGLVGWEGEVKRDARDGLSGSGAEIDPPPRAQVRVVFFEFGQHAHGERHGRADPFGPLVQVLA